MNPEETALSSRREFLQSAGVVVAASALGGAAIPAVHAAGDGLIQIALVGCGGRGSGAAVDALSTKGGPTRLVAMADAYGDRLAGSHHGLRERLGDRMDVPKDRQFVGFDAYRKAMDCLKPGDVVILATPPAFRWVHFQYAVQKKLNVFMEKPVTVDGPTSKRMLALADQSASQGLKVGVGLMSRHARHLQELHQRVRDGQMGDIILMRGYRMHGPIGYFESGRKPADISELDYQVRRFHSFLWSGGGAFSDFYIHIIDHLCWMKNAWPVKAQALGGRHYRGDSVDQNFDTYAVEYTFADGTKMLFDGRCMNGATGIYHSALHGTKGTALASRGGDCGGPAAIWKGLSTDQGEPAWQSTDRSNPYRNEWDDLMAAIRGDKPFNEARRGIEASLVTSLGRMAAHTGVEVTYEQILNSDHEMAPGLDKLTSTSPAPLQPDANGRYPVPQPGIVTQREY